MSEDIEYSRLTSGFEERMQIETPPSTAFGEFIRGQDDEGNDTLSFRTVQHRAGPPLPELVRVSMPGWEHLELIDRLPTDEYAVEASFSLGGDLPAGLIWIDAREVFRPMEAKTFDPVALLHRLQDRHLTGEMHYSAENFEQLAIRRDEAATCLDPHAEAVTAGQVREKIEELQAAHAAGHIPPILAASFDEAPGFSWIEPELLEGRLYPAIRAVVRRHGEPILCDRDAREGEAGLANTLKLTDIIVHAPEMFPEARSDLAQLKKGGWIFMIRAAGRGAAHLSEEMEITDDISGLEG